MTEILCSCGKRPKNKCSKESGVGGKMCLKYTKYTTFEEDITRLHEYIDDIKSEVVEAFPILKFIKR